jgi:hypothetical protein
MFNLPSRLKLPASWIVFTMLAIVSVAALSTPAFASKQSALVNACKRMGPRCSLAADTPGYAQGCTAKVCFECINGKCGKVGGAPLVSDTGGYKRPPGSTSPGLLDDNVSIAPNGPSATGTAIGAGSRSGAAAGVR